MKARNRTLLAAVALLVALVAMSVVVPVAAQSPRQFTAPDIVRSGPSAGLQFDAIVRDAARTADGRIKVIVTLANPPAGRAFAQAGGRGNRGVAQTAAANATAAVRAEQSAFTASAQMLGAEVLRSTQFAVNTVTVAVVPEGLRSLYVLPGVRNITPVRIVERDHTTSVPLIRAPGVWDSTFPGGGYTGEGVTIAIIDDGIDYTHLHFGGSGGYATNDPTNGTDYAGWPPAAVPASVGDQKVIGGTDLVGDDYDAAGSGAELTPVPDPDPVSCSNLDGFTGHGTHVAGTAAGWGVVPTGPSTFDTFSGDYSVGQATLYPNYPAGDVTTWHIGPGVAPGANLVAIRVFGCAGSTGTDVLLDALEMAGSTSYLSEDVDVINMSLGSAYGGAGDDDPLVDAQETLIAGGIVIVDSAGNNGNVTFVSGAPGSSESVISVANVTDSSAIVDAEVQLTSGVGSPLTIKAVTNSVFGLQSFTAFSGTMVIADPAVGCGPLVNGAAIAGNIAIIDRGNCEFSAKANNALDAGAAGVIVVNNNGAAPFTMGNGTVEPADTGVDAIPVVMVSQVDGTTLKTAAAGANTVELTSDVLAVAPDTASRIVTSSSRGGAPRGTGDVVFKPNVAAPGDTIASAGAGTDYDMNVIGGTSMASPHVAGLAALLLDSNASLTPAEIKAAVMNTADPGVVLAALPGTAVQPPQRVGAGQVDAVQAVTIAGSQLAYATQNPNDVTLSFGLPKVLMGDTLTDTRTISIANNSGASITYALSLIQRSDMLGANVAFSLPAATVTVPDGVIEEFDVTLTANPGQPSANTITYAFDASANTTFLTEESALVLIHDQAAGVDTSLDMVVPVYAAPHVVSDMSATLDYANSYFGYSLEQSGDEIWTGSLFGSHISSVASVFELVATDPDDVPGSYEPRPGDFYTQDDSEAYDIAAVGVTSDYSADPSNPFASLYFAIATYGEWNTPKEGLYVIVIDSDRDGAGDFSIYNSASANNVYQSVFSDDNNYFGFGAGAAFIDWYVNDQPGTVIDTMLFKNNVMFLPFTFADWNTVLPAGKEIAGAFDFWVETYSRDGDFVDVQDSVGSSAAPFTFDPTNPAFSFNDLGSQSDHSMYAGPGPGPFTGSPIYFDWTGYAIPVDVNPDYSGTLPDILVLHHHNANAADRYEVIDTAGIDLPDSGSGFDLLTPENGAYFRDPADLTEFTWETPVSEDVLQWRFILTQISTNTRLGEVLDLGPLTSAADADELTCDATVCTLDASAVEPLDDGQYSWTAANYAFSEVEANNAPFFFTLETNDVNMIANPGFEGCAGGSAPSWTGKCKVDALAAHSGDAYFLGKKGKYANQTIAHPALDTLGSGDDVDFGGFFNGKAAAKTVATATIKYDDNTAGVNNNGKDKIKVKIQTTTVGYEALESTLTLDGTVKSAKVKFGSATSKVSVDDVWFSTPGINGPETRVDGVLPPPAAPSGFRGNN